MITVFKLSRVKGVLNNNANQLQISEVCKRRRVWHPLINNIGAADDPHISTGSALHAAATYLLEQSENGSTLQLNILHHTISSTKKDLKTITLGSYCFT